ncbi:kinase-like domain-containing protein [Glomus cerebriforme]|uniref:Kinase-like domain-containing protein n=1 Tax=Glomus cerebriforme TaxID=658196 RepID=A0A397SLF6_9GLOM|nr:kinase-like domain-containing protein [Glomus cerebriforme]
MSISAAELLHSWVHASTDYNVYNDIHKRYEFRKQEIIAVNSTTQDVKTEALRMLSESYDRSKIQNNNGTRRICENCKPECLATLFCEFCVRNYLKANFSNWTSGNDAKSHLTISNKWASIVQCFGITQDPLNGNYMLNAVHRDLHSGNILVSLRSNRWFISDLGFCGPADKPSKTPEVIVEKQTTEASDIYSIGMLMWEISSGQPPFVYYEHDYDLAMNIVNGIRPKVVSGTPSKYKSLMKQCWDADPLKRPDAKILLEKLRKFRLKYEDESNELIQQNNNTNYTRLSKSKVHLFEQLPEPRNATEEEQEAFHSKPYNYHIPEKVDDFQKSSTSTMSR